MRRFIGVSAVLCGALLAHGQRGADLIGNYVKALQEGKTFSATYTLQRIGGAARTVSVDFAKPNMLRIDTPAELIVADGKQITTYDKAGKSYYVKPQTANEFKGLLSSEDVGVWAPFFDAKVFAGMAGAKALPAKNRGGVTLQVVEATMDADGRQVVTLYLASDNLARQAEITTNNNDGKDTVILNAKSIALGGEAASFAFVAPAGSRQLTEEELNADRWYTDLEEALAVAKRTNRLVMLDFYTDW